MQKQRDSQRRSETRTVTRQDVNRIHTARREKHTVRRSGLAFFAALGVALVTVMVSLSLSTVSAYAEDEGVMRFIRIGTGPTGGTYFPIGGLIANAISNPPGSRPCDKGGHCGVPGVVAVAQSTNGSVENIRRLIAGNLDFALVQAGIAFLAMNIGDLYDGQKPFKKLRAVARLYPEYVHLVAQPEKAIASIKDVRGKHVAMGDPGSGTLLETKGILEAYGIGVEDILPSYERPIEAAGHLKEGQIDALFFISGAPNSLVTELLQGGRLALVPINGKGAERIIARSPFFTKGLILKDKYPNMKTGDVWTLSVDTLLVTTTDLPDTLVEGITRSIWHPSSLHLYERGVPQATALSPEKAITGIGIPLHGGAQRVYFNVKQSG